MSKRILPPFQDAVAFLTVIPAPCPLLGPDPSQKMGRAMAWFPAVGALIGGLGTGVVSLTDGWWPGSICAAAGLAAMTWITGGLHLDGYADTVDGLAGGRSAAERLEIMRDSRLGTMAAAALVFLLGLKWMAIQTAQLTGLIQGLVAAGALSRWAMVLSARYFSYVPGREGLGRLVAGRKENGPWVAATLTALALSICCFGPWIGLSALALAAALAWGLNRFFTRQLGGITGDTMGAISECTELAVLLVAAAQ